MLQESSRTCVKDSVVCVSQRKVIETELLLLCDDVVKTDVKYVMLNFKQRFILGVIYD